MESSSSMPKASTDSGSRGDMSDEEKSRHLGFMREALAMAEFALKNNETPVGCIFVYNNNIIGRGINATNRTYNGTRHAEFIALDSVLSSTNPVYHPSILKECDLYVTVEPCIMCASLLRQMGIGKVYFGASNEKFGGTGGVLSIHERNGKEKNGEGDEGSEESDYEVSGGWLREEAIVLLRRFYVQENERAPEPKGKKGRVLRLDVDPIQVNNLGNNEPA